MLEAFHVSPELRTPTEPCFGNLGGTEGGYGGEDGHLVGLLNLLLLHSWLFVVWKMDE